MQGRLETEDWIVKQFPENFRIETDEFLNGWKYLEQLFVGELRVMLIIGMVTFGCGIRTAWALPLGIIAGFLEYSEYWSHYLLYSAFFETAIFGSYWLPLDNS